MGGMSSFILFKYNYSAINKHILNNHIDPSEHIFFLKKWRLFLNNIFELFKNGRSI